MGWELGEALTEPPSNLLHALADAICVDHHGNVEEQEISAGALGPRAVLETLDRVQRLQRREPPGKTNAKQVDGHDDAVRQVGRVDALGGEGRE